MLPELHFVPQQQQACNRGAAHASHAHSQPQGAVQLIVRQRHQTLVAAVLLDGVADPDALNRVQILNRQVFHW